jgi:hypothetical protein
VTPVKYFIYQLKEKRENWKNRKKLKSLKETMQEIDKQFVQLERVYQEEKLDLELVLGNYFVSAKSDVLSLAGGGNTIAAIDQFGLTNKIRYISTAGGALVEALMGKKLPGVTALESATETKKLHVQ